MKDLNNYIIALVVLIISFLPKNNTSTHFDISLLTEGLINKFIIICVVFLLLMEDYNLGIVFFLLAFSLFFIDPKNVSEGFVSYYRNF